MSKTLVMVLAGGQGSRLMPLTTERAKPAVPFGGIYRIIDFVLSNFVNSGYMQIKVLTQFMSNSLNQHIARNWGLSMQFNQYVETVPAQQRTGDNWYLGSADAIYQNLNIIRDERPEHVFVFSGDHIYKMDVSQMFNFHLHKDADMTIAAIPVPLKEASDFGVIEVDENWRMIGFEEKPKKPKSIPGNPDLALASMGNYIFKRDILAQAVSEDADKEGSVHDFGKNIIPALYPKKKVYIYDYLSNKIRLPDSDQFEKPYWRDVGTLWSYWESHMELVSVSPAVNLYNRNWPIFGFPDVNMPSAKFVFADQANQRVGLATDSMVSVGCIISGGRIDRTILSPGVRVNSYALVENSIILNNTNVGRYCRIRNAIIDKNVTIPNDTEIGYDPEQDKARGFTVTGEGLVVVPKGYKF
ncbi:MAG TPA: glucose-1-phosphate adenylyltransferase [bacterium]|nr:glucose-1-phosphate adenylyltransferase [bacterium]